MCFFNIYIVYLIFIFGGALVFRGCAEAPAPIAPPLSQSLEEEWRHRIHVAWARARGLELRSSDLTAERY